MKKITHVAAILLSVVACTRNQEIDVPDAILSLIAKTESSSDSRTIVEGGVHIYWETGDEIMVFSGEKSAKFTTDITASSATVTFKGTFGEETWPDDMDLWAVYPYSEEAVFDGETITAVLPSEQVARAGSFGKDMNLAIAHSSGTTLQFYNVGGGLRFSVTEEGIKKVMFEGLGGEIISGKVKIRFENGLPVVQEVLNGSQFITLLPPEGSDAFQKDTWYYIVAIPGTLEKGYKLRFYKDDDYARKVCEKAVEIKRSIYGNIEKADEGIEYEAQTIHFPETQEEWIESDQIALDVSEGIGSILSSMGVNGDYSDKTQELVEQIRLLDNVKNIVVNEITNGFSIQLKDSSWFNYVYELPGYNDIEGEYEEDLPNTNQIIQPNRVLKASSSIITPGKNKALVVAPYQSRGVDGSLSNGFISVDFNYIESQLNAIGYEMVPLKNKDYTISDLTGDRLKQYGLIIFATHGIYSYSSSGNQVYQTAIDTGVSYHDTDNLPQREQLARITLGNKGKNLHYYITDSWLKGTTTNLSDNSFNNTIICMSACESYHLSDLADFFLQHGAGGYCGNYLELPRQFNKPIVKSLVHSLCSGMSFPEAVNYVESDPLVTETFAHDWIIDHVQPLSLHGDTKKDNPEVYLVNPYPKNLNAQVKNGSISFSWEQNKTTGSYSFDVYVGTKKVKTTYNQLYCSISTDIVGTGTHEWSIVANLYQDSDVLASFRVVGEPFTVKEETSGNNVIYYTSSDSQVISPAYNYGFGAKIVSNEYVNGKGIITFDGDVTSIGAFSNCSTLTSITIPESVTSLGDYCFLGCSSLVSITIPESTSSIGCYSFSGCSSLVSVTIPESVKGIEHHCFYGCSNLASVTIHGYLSELPDHCFSDCSKLSSITIPSSVTRLGTFCFDGCSSLTSIILPGSLITLDTFCFCGCSALTSIIIPNSVTSLGDSCFRGCSSLSNIFLPQHFLTIGNACFYGCKSLVSITLPNSITQISDGCFGACTSLRSFTIPETVTSLGSYCFNGCSSLNSIHIPESVTSIGSGCFGSTGLTSIVIPETVTSLQDGCFAHSSSLRSITIPDTVISIGEKCFSGCSSLTSISVPQGVSKLNDYCFENCSSLVSITIPEAVTSIGYSCFGFCKNLATITIPEKVTNIAGFCFNCCSGLASIYMRPTTPPAGGECMFQVTSCPIFVPANSYYDYIEAPFWKEETSRIQPMGGPNPNSEGVDLGLSVNWAAYNLGAWYPEEYGDYFAWGESHSKQSFSWGNYELCDGDMNSIWIYTYDDQLTTLDRYDDAAACILEGNWRMPTKEEWGELINNCSWKRYTRNGVDGMLATSTVPGYSSAHIFFPFSGQKDGDELKKDGSMGYYWTSSLSPFTSMGCIGTTTPDTGYLERYMGLPIRPVYDDK